MPAFRERCHHCKLSVGGTVWMGVQEHLWMTANRVLQAGTGSPESGHHNYDLCPEPSLWYLELHRAKLAPATTSPHPGASAYSCLWIRGPVTGGQLPTVHSLTFPSITPSPMT